MCVCYLPIPVCPHEGFMLDKETIGKVFFLEYIRFFRLVVTPQCSTVMHTAS